VTAALRRAAPALAAAAAILVGEIALPRALHRPLDPSRRYGRNPHLRRGWNEYIEVTGHPRPGEVRVLLLSNSQGNGPEYPERAIYSWLLQDALNEGRSGLPIRVVNWSFGPNRVPEAIALLARAQDLQPHLTVCVFNAAWFQPNDYRFQGRPTPLSMFPGDVVDTAWFDRDRVPAAYREHYLRPVTAISAMFARFWPTYRYRDLPVSWLQAEQPWFRPFVPEGEWAAWFLAARARRSRVQVQPIVGQVPPPPQPELVDMFTEAAARVPGRHVFAFQPHYYLFRDGAEPPDAVGPILRQRGFELWDMSHAVPWQQFLEGQQVHLADDGHRTFAAALSERIRPLLPEATAPR
jgi:hypothetical protein